MARLLLTMRHLAFLVSVALSWALVLCDGVVSQHDKHGGWMPSSERTRNLFEDEPGAISSARASSKHNRVVHRMPFPPGNEERLPASGSDDGVSSNDIAPSTSDSTLDTFVMEEGGGKKLQSNSETTTDDPYSDDFDGDMRLDPNSIWSADGDDESSPDDPILLQPSSKDGDRTSQENSSMNEGADAGHKTSPADENSNSKDSDFLAAGKTDMGDAEAGEEDTSADGSTEDGEGDGGGFTDELSPKGDSAEPVNGNSNTKDGDFLAAGKTDMGDAEAGEEDTSADGSTEDGEGDGGGFTDELSSKGDSAEPVGANSNTKDGDFLAAGKTDMGDAEAGEEDTSADGSTEDGEGDGGGFTDELSPKGDSAEPVDGNSNTKDGDFLAAGKTDMGDAEAGEEDTSADGSTEDGEGDGGGFTDELSSKGDSAEPVNGNSNSKDGDFLAAGKTDMGDAEAGEEDTSADGSTEDGEGDGGGFTDELSSKGDSAEPVGANSNTKDGDFLAAGKTDMGDAEAGEEDTSADGSTEDGEGDGGGFTDELSPKGDSAEPVDGNSNTKDGDFLAAGKTDMGDAEAGEEDTSADGSTEDGEGDGGGFTDELSSKGDSAEPVNGNSNSKDGDFLAAGKTDMGDAEAGEEDTSADGSTEDGEGDGGGFTDERSPKGDSAEPVDGNSNTKDGDFLAAGKTDMGDAEAGEEDTSADGSTEDGEGDGGGFTDELSPKGDSAGPAGEKDTSADDSTEDGEGDGGDFTNIWSSTTGETSINPSTSSIDEGHDSNDDPFEMESTSVSSEHEGGTTGDSVSKESGQWSQTDMGMESDSAGSDTSGMALADEENGSPARSNSNDESSSDSNHSTQDGSSQLDDEDSSANDTGPGGHSPTDGDSEQQRSDGSPNDDESSEGQGDAKAESWDKGDDSKAESEEDDSSSDSGTSHVQSESGKSDQETMKPAESSSGDGLSTFLYYVLLPLAFVGFCFLILKGWMGRRNARAHDGYQQVEAAPDLEAGDGDTDTEIAMAISASLDQPQPSRSSNRTSDRSLRAAPSDNQSSSIPNEWDMDLDSGEDSTEPTRAQPHSASLQPPAATAVTDIDMDFSDFSDFEPSSGHAATASDTKLPKIVATAAPATAAPLAGTTESWSGLGGWDGGEMWGDEGESDSSNPRLGGDLQQLTREIESSHHEAPSSQTSSDPAPRIATGASTPTPAHPVKVDMDAEPDGWDDFDEGWDDK